jgi:Fic family protein
MCNCNWQQKDWTQFTYSTTAVEDDLLLFAEKAGRVLGIVESMTNENSQETIINLLLAEAIKNSEIEGEYPSRQDVLSSIRKNLGLNSSPENIKDKSAAGLGEMMIAVRNSYKEPLTAEMLFAWHKMLLGTNKRITTGDWRFHEEPMQVVSGRIGKEKVHFLAPPSAQVKTEMEAFLKWFNNTAPGGENEIKKAPIRAAIAHVYFETIHPFEDGNGRIGRAISEKALSQTLGKPALLSLSRTIAANKSAYYLTLEKAQQSNNITNWITYFVKTLLNAQEEAEAEIDFTLKKTRLFDQYKSQLNTRQLAVVKRMLAEGAKGFEGGMNAKKYKSIADTSKATATRDMQWLLAIGIFVPNGKGGRSTSFNINI